MPILLFPSETKSLSKKLSRILTWVLLSGFGWNQQQQLIGFSKRCSVISAKVFLVTKFNLNIQALAFEVMFPTKERFCKTKTSDIPLTNHEGVSLSN